MSTGSASDDEQTPLLKNSQQSKAVQKQKQQNAVTPLPWGQLSIILFLQLAEPLTSQVIYPFTPELIRSLKVAKDEAEVGYYVGIMQSLFFATQALTVLHWSRLSDLIGRKPVILMGLFGLSISMYCFGLSRTFWGLVLSRCINGILNGNIGVIKSMMAEICDQTNLALALSYMPLAWNTGGTLGPIIGGVLSRPAERFPELFGNSQFLKDYPYFLPCALPATFSLVAWLVTYLYMKETVISPMSIRQLLGFHKKQSSIENGSEQAIDAKDRPYSTSELLIPQVLIAASNYAMLALVDIAFRALLPLFCSTPVALGGLGMSPPLIGSILSYFGILNGVFQILFFARLNTRFGSKNIFLLGVISTVPCFVLFPITNAAARQAGGELTPFVWVLVAFQVSLSVLVSLSYGAVFMYIAASSPNRASLGATNGLAQLMCSIVRAIGPALTNSLFSLSIDEKHHYLGGKLVYVVALALSFISIGSGLLLPKKVWKDKQ